VSLAYPSSVHRRGLGRKIMDTLEAYIRIDLVEERMFPALTVLRYISVIFPVLLYFYQSTFLSSGGNLFVVMLIGIAVTTGLQDALTGLTSRLHFAMERGTLETYLVEPVPWALIPFAMNIWRSITGAGTTCLMILIGWLLGAPIKGSGVPAALGVLFLGILACNALGTLFAAFILLFKRGEPLVLLFAVGATVLGGALFPVSVLPGWIRWTSYFIPQSYVINGIRQLLMYTPPAGPSAGASTLGLLVFCAVTFTLGLFLFDRSLRLARRLGILSI
jgi:ABC-2 type transport system permease protein